MVITRFVFEWFAGINCIILRSQIPVLLKTKTKFATIKWYNLCRQIIQSQTCYPLSRNIDHYAENYATDVLWIWHFISEDRTKNCRDRKLANDNYITSSEINVDDNFKLEET